MTNPDYWIKLKCGLEHILKTQRLENKEVYVLPADEYAVEVVEYLRDKNIFVKAILDNRKQVLGQTLCGVPIKAVEDELYPFYSEKQLVLATSYCNMQLIQKLDFIECWHNVSRFLLCEDIYQNKKSISIKESRLILRLKSVGVVRILRSAVWYKKAEKQLRKIRATAQGRIYLFPHRSIGDIYILGTYLSQGNEKFQCEYLLVVVGNACKKIAEQSGFKRVVAVEQKEMDMLLRYKLFMGDIFSELDILHYDYLGHSIYSNIFDQKEFSFFQCYQHLVFDEATDFVNKGFEKRTTAVEAFCRDNKIVKGKTVILAPYCKSIPDISPVFWEKLAKNLIKKGFCVISNCGTTTERAVFGTKQMNIPFELINDVINYAGYFVGIRSGLCDVVSGCSAKKVVVFPKLKGNETSLHDFYSFTGVDMRYPIDEVEYNRIPDIENDVKDVVEILINK